MSNSSNVTSLCDSGDRICVVRMYEQEIIVVPVLLLATFLGTLLTLCLLRLRPKKDVVPIQKHQTRNHHQNRNGNRKNHLQGIDAPLELNPLEDEAPQAVPLHSQQMHNHHPIPRQHRSSRQHLQGIDAPQEFNPLEFEVTSMSAPMQNNSPRPQVSGPLMSTETQHGTFQQITPLPLAFTVKPNNTVSLYQAVRDQRPVILRVLKESANAREQQAFLGFAHFLSELGGHPSLPSLLGVIAVGTPFIMVMEELTNRDLLGFLWRCRQEHTSMAAPCNMTEKQIFVMGGQIASGLEYLHSKNCIHGNVAARSILVGQDLSVKLWGFGPAFRREMEKGSSANLEKMEITKWQAPEVLANRNVSQSSDIWSMGILLYEMVTFGEPPFPKFKATELLQYLQRGKSLQRPVFCSNSLYSIIKACCQWCSQDRPTLTEVISKLKQAERRANDTVMLQVPEPIDMEKYMREAGYGEGYNYALL